MIDTGRGPAIVLIPGIQGRWEWMTPTIETLARRHRVLSFSLTDLPRGDISFAAWATLIDGALDRAGIASAAVVGVSFGGLVAMYYAAVRPARATALVIASTPSPRWRPDPRTSFYMRWPRLVMPLMVARSVIRLMPEIVAAGSSWRARVTLAGAYAWRVVRYPLLPARMVSAVEAWLAIDLEARCRRVVAPTMLITGDRGLERVVPIESTLEIAHLIPHARHVHFAGTGHIGCVTKPDQFADLIASAVTAAETGLPARREAS
jgi:pimeloyl-ACP methyl ester carboxylesterase